MPSAFALAEINHQLETVVAELEAVFAQQGHANFLLVRQAGGIAGLLGRPDLSARLGVIISGLAIENIFGGAVTNLDRSDIDATRLARIKSPPEISREHPFCDDDFLIARMKSQTDHHLQLCLQGDIQGALQAATSERALEEIGCTLAALGQFEHAASLIDAQPVEDRARMAVRFVTVLEKCRRGHADFRQPLQQARLDGFDRLCVALALAGRLPWIGYPYSDW